MPGGYRSSMAAEAQQLRQQQQQEQRRLRQEQQQQQHGALQRVEIDKAWFCERRGAAIYRLRADRAGHATKTTEEKRFSDFHALHKHLLERFGKSILDQAGIPPIPSKKLLGNRDANLIESRRHHFEMFMQACVGAPELRDHEPLRSFIGLPANPVELRVAFDPATGTALAGGPADEHVLYTFDLYMGDKKVDMFQARYSREAARHREMTTKGLLQNFVPPLEFPPANHVVDMTRDPQRVAERGVALQHYYQRLLTDGGEELRTKLGCSAEELRLAVELPPGAGAGPGPEPEPEPESEKQPEPEEQPGAKPDMEPAGKDSTCAASTGGMATLTGGHSDAGGGISAYARSLAEVDGASGGIAVAAGATYIAFHCDTAAARTGETGMEAGTNREDLLYCGTMEAYHTAVVVAVAILLVGLVASALARLRKH